MDLIDQLRSIASRAQKQQEHIKTEEATKNAVIMPFISALGYDVFNPLEVVPEFTADIGKKKGEKVDYAIKKDDKIILLIECKALGADLSTQHMDQLHRYFHTTEARFGIITNGTEYRFYSDIKETNKMDTKPFFVFDLMDFEEHHINELKKFAKASFSLEEILTTASGLKYAGAIKKILDQELESPSEEFVKFFAKRVYDGVMNKRVVEQFTAIVKDAREQFINEKINNRLKSALASKDQNKTDNATTEEKQPLHAPDDGIITTQDEIDGYNIVRAIMAGTVELDRVIMKDAKSYCSILLDNNNRRPICRLHFNAAQKHLGIVENKQEERIPISSIDEIYNYAERLKEITKTYL